MFLRLVWLSVIVGFLATSDAFPAESNSHNVQLKTLPTYSTTTNGDRRMLKSYVTEIDEDNGSTEEDKSEERIDTALVAQFESKLEALKISAMFKDWFQGGKTLGQVRTLLSLPAKGEAITSTNWPKFLKYLEFVEEQKVFAAALAKAEAAKMRLTYQNWCLDNKTLEQVRKILGLPSKGKAVDHPYWAKFEDFLNYRKEFFKRYS